MARPLEETPILTGKDSERFYERLANAVKKKLSEERIAEIHKAYEIGMSIMSK